MEQVNKILRSLGWDLRPETAEPFRAEEDGRAYQVWKLKTADGTFVLKKTTPGERAVYETFLQNRGPWPQALAFAESGDGLYMLMEFVPGNTMSRCARDRLIRMLDALMESQRGWWEKKDFSHVGYGFDRCWPDRCSRLAWMGELSQGYQAYLDAFAAAPRTLCNDDMLPFNVLEDGERAVILDWEYGGILPWPCALARFLAFGEPGEGLFQLTDEDRQFALDYYYEHLIREKGISRAEYDRTMDLFFLKEYTEWIYCAGKSGDFEMENYKKYSPMAKAMARKLGLFREKEVEACFD